MNRRSMSGTLTRRQVLQVLTALAPATAVARMSAQTTTIDAPLSADVLPRGVRARFVNNVNGIRMQVLEAGFGGSADSTSLRPAVLLVHGFPELAYSWRNVMLP